MYLKTDFTPLPAICDLITDGSHFSPTPQEEGHPIVNAKDIPNGRINLDSCTRISQRDWDLLRKQNCAPKINDILLSKDGTIGRVVHYDYDLGVVVLSSVAILRPKTSIDSRFLAQALRSDSFRRQLLVLESGSALRRIVLNDIKKLEFWLPPEKATQTEIADILAMVDRATEQTEALIAKQERIKTGLMQGLLTRGIDEHGNLRSESTHEFKESSLGRIPNEWEISNLGKLAEFRSGYAFKNQELSEFGWRVVRISNLHKPDFPYWHYKGKVRQSWVIQNGDVLFSWAGVASSIDCILYQGPDALMNQHIYNFVFASNDLKMYVYHFLQHYLPQLRTEIEGGAGQLHLTKRKIQAIPIPLPDAHEIRQIVAKISSIDSVEAGTVSELAKLRSMKAGLMQDLLTGRKRVTPLLALNTGH